MTTDRTNSPAAPPRPLGRHTYLVAAWVGLTALFIVLAPSASEGLGLLLRLVFWALHVGLALTILQIAQSWMGRLPLTARLGGWSQVALSGVVGGLAFAPIALLLDRIFPEDGDAPLPLLQELSSEAASVLPAVALVWLGLNAPRLMAISTASSEVTLSEASAFWAKVPQEIGRDLVRLEAELHYLRVVTTSGNALILYPFGKAVEDLADATGLQVHRSHWVALPHVARLERRGDGGTLILDNGEAIPVSRRNRKTVADALSSRD